MGGSRPSLLTGPVPGVEPVAWRAGFDRTSFGRMLLGFPMSVAGAIAPDTRFGFAPSDLSLGRREWRTTLQTQDMIGNG